MTTKVTTKGQVTIPKRIRDLYGLIPGSKVDFQMDEDGRIVLVRAGARSQPGRFERLRGHAGPGPSTDEIMALLRGEPE
jgi:AbrB family looped-hinge helix DNA binding protein